MVRLYSDWSEIDAELNRVETIAIIDAHLNLTSVLKRGEALVTAAIDVESGSLKGSVNSSTSLRGGGNWHGEIIVGGGVGSVGPIDYAWYEYRRGGAHSFFYPLPLLHEAYVEAILDGLRP